VSARPPTDRPTRVLLDLDYSRSTPLIIDSPGQGTATVQLFSEDDLRDCTLDTEVGLLAGADQDRYGLTFRQSAEERYAACTITPTGHLAIGLVDHGPALVVAEASLTDLPGFQPGIGARNRVSVVVCGPTATCLVNGVAVAAAMLDARYASGRVGAVLVHTSPAADVRAGVTWAQARAILPEA
jgi:hypothetical protein